MPIRNQSMYAVLLKAGKELRCPTVMATLSSQGEGVTKDMAAYAGAVSASQHCPKLEDTPPPEVMPAHEAKLLEHHICRNILPNPAGPTHEGELQLL